MVRKLVTATVSAALCTASFAPGLAAAQEHRFAGFDAPRGVTATVNLRVPFGRTPRAGRASYGLTVGYGQTVAPGLDGRTATRAVNLADLRFAGGELAQARVASFDLANLERDRRLNLVGKKSTLLLGAIIVGAILICVAADCFGGDDDTPN
jgi:hypothetical protein